MLSSSSYTIADLVDEIFIHHIFQELDINSILRARLVCKTWGRCVCQEFWRTRWPLPEPRTNSQSIEEVEETLQPFRTQLHDDARYLTKHYTLQRSHVMYLANVIRRSRPDVNQRKVQSILKRRQRRHWYNICAVLGLFCYTVPLPGQTFISENDTTGVIAEHQTYGIYVVRNENERLAIVAPLLVDRKPLAQVDRERLEDTEASFSPLLLERWKRKMAKRTERLLQSTGKR